MHLIPEQREVFSMPALATSPRIVRDGINRFQDEVRRSPRLANRLPYARAWYVCRDDEGRWRFGPSKFVGYEGLTAEQYVELSRKGLDGRRTEAQLRQWYVELDPSSELHEELSAQLSAFLAEHGKAPSRKMRISIPKELRDEGPGYGGDGERALMLDLIVAFAESLRPSELEALRERLRVIGAR